MNRLRVENCQMFWKVSQKYKYKVAFCQMLMFL